MWVLFVYPGIGFGAGFSDLSRLFKIMALACRFRPGQLILYVAIAYSYIWQFKKHMAMFLLLGQTARDAADFLALLSDTLRRGHAWDPEKLGVQDPTLKTQALNGSRNLVVSQIQGPPYMPNILESLILGPPKW